MRSGFKDFNDFLDGDPQDITLSYEISRTAYNGLSFGVETGDSGLNFASVAEDLSGTHWEGVRIEFTLPIEEYRTVFDSNAPDIISKLSSLDFNIFPAFSEAFSDILDVPIEYKVIGVEKEIQNIGVSVLGNGFSIELYDDVEYSLQRGVIQNVDGNFGIFEIESYDRPTMIMQVIGDYLTSQYDFNNLLNDAVNEVISANNPFALLHDCPSDLVITNSQAQRIGIINGTYYNEIPEAFACFSNSSEIEMYVLPSDDTYLIEIIGNESGKYTFTAVQMSDNETKMVSVTDSWLENNSKDGVVINENMGYVLIESGGQERSFNMTMCYQENGIWRNSTITNLVITKNSTHTQLCIQKHISHIHD